MEISDFEEFIKPCLKDGKKFLWYGYQNLLAAGENYGSLMLKVTIEMLNHKNERETIHCVAKTVPPNEFLQKIFNTKITFKTEIGVYKTIVPILNEFGREKGIDDLMSFFAKCLNARISLNPNSDIVDKDALLLLENLKVQGYESLDRFHGFDLECAKLLLKDLATFHAAPIAYRKAKPEEFKSKIYPYLGRKMAPESSDEFINIITKITVEGAARNPECVPHLAKLKDALQNLKAPPAPLRTDEPFATIVHNDLWTNNIMMKMVDGKPQKNMIVDFQNIEYGTPGVDIIFFLYSSVSLEVLREGIDDLIEYYYERFIATLKKLDCDVSDFSLEQLKRECAIAATEREFIHLMVMLNPIFTLKNKAKELTEFKETDILVDSKSRHENYYKRLQFILLDFIKHGWI